MPFRDGTGPAGRGPLTGRGLGRCVNAVARVGRGLWRGGRSFLRSGRRPAGVGRSLGRRRFLGPFGRRRF